MAVLDYISLLRQTLSPGSDVLTNPEDPAFHELLKRWTDIDLKLPAAIILPSSEDDCLKAVIILPTTAQDLPELLLTKCRYNGRCNRLSPL